MDKLEAATASSALLALAGLLLAASSPAPMARIAFGLTARNRGASPWSAPTAVSRGG